MFAHILIMAFTHLYHIPINGHPLCLIHSPKCVDMGGPGRGIVPTLIRK